MFMSYRRTGGVFALLTFAAVAFAGMVLTAAVAAIVLMIRGRPPRRADVARRLLHELRDGVAVPRLSAERLEDQHVERARQEHRIRASHKSVRGVIDLAVRTCQAAAGRPAAGRPHWRRVCSDVAV